MFSNVLNMAQRYTPSNDSVFKVKYTIITVLCF